MGPNTHHTKLKGDIAVSAVIFDLTKRGFIISEPMSENSPYDIICDAGKMGLFRIQVKCRKNAYIPKATSWADRNGSHTRPIDLSKIDFFALVNDDYSKICYPSVKLAGKSFNWDIPVCHNEYYYWEDYKEFMFDNFPKRKNTKDEIKTMIRIKQ